MISSAVGAAGLGGSTSAGCGGGVTAGGGGCGFGSTARSRRLLLAPHLFEHDEARVRLRLEPRIGVGRIGVATIGVVRMLDVAELVVRLGQVVEQRRHLPDLVRARQQLDGAIVIGAAVRVAPLRRRAARPAPRPTPRARAPPVAAITITATTTSDARTLDTALNVRARRPSCQFAARGVGVAATAKSTSLWLLSAPFGVRAIDSPFGGAGAAAPSMNALVAVP